MPFNMRPDLPDAPLVRVFFSGQLILAPAPSTSSGERDCEVFVNRLADGHTLTVEARKKHRRGPDEILMRHVGPLGPSRFGDEPDGTYGMFIGIAPEDGPRGVNGYDGTTASDEGTTLRHAITLAGLHRDASRPVDLAVDRRSAGPSILLNDATLYSAALATGQFEVVKQGESPTPLGALARLLGANIYPTEEQEVVVMRWKTDDRIEELALPMPSGGEGFTYEVYVTNDPLYAGGGLGAAHDELSEYYKILPGVPASERFVFRPATTRAAAAAAGMSYRGSTTTPCMPVGWDFGWDWIWD
jgi:hypothetical protein